MISITAHGGAISALFRVIGHRPFQVQTAGVVPVMVRQPLSVQLTSGQGELEANI